MKEYQEVELALLQKKVQELEMENIKLKKILEENGLAKEEVKISDAEAICIREIKKLRELSESGKGLALEDVKLFDILHKNLLLAQGKEVPKEEKNKKTGPKEVADLLKLVQDKK